MNLLPNPGFEVDLTGWVFVSDESGRTTKKAHSGIAAAFMGGGPGAYMYGPYVTVTLGTPYRAEVWVTGTGTVRYSLRYGGEVLVQSALVVLDETWQKITVEHTPTAYQYIFPLLIHEGSGVAEVTSDDYSIEAVTAAVPSGSGAGSWSVAGLAVGAAVRQGQGVGSWAVTGLASGGLTKAGVAVGSWSVTGVATGSRARYGLAVGSWSTSGTAQGQRPSPPIPPPVQKVLPADHARLEVMTSPGVWTVLTSDTKTISVSRADSDPGTITAEVLNADLDPTTGSLIRTGKPIRARVLDGAVWRSFYTGTVNDVSVDYNPLAPEHARANVKISGVDNVSRLANQTEVQGVGTVNDLRWLVGNSVPFLINGSSATLPTGTLVATNDNASLWDQILVTRDTALGYAWVDTENRLRVNDRVSMDTTVVAVVGPETYGTIDTNFTSDQIINTVSVIWRRFNIGTDTSTDVTYGPYVDSASVAEWGTHSATFTIQGVTEVESQIVAYATAVLANNAQPEIRAKSVRIPLQGVPSLALVRDIDLNSRVKIVFPDDTTTKTLRVIGVGHEISGTQWFLSLTLAPPEGVAVPSVTPGTGVGYTPPGSIGEDELESEVLDRIEEAFNNANAAASAAATAASTATTALGAANGKNKVTFSTSGPGSTANIAGDVWFMKDAPTQTIIGQWEGLGGTSWSAKTIRNEVIANLDAGKLIAGTAFTNALTVKTLFTLGDAAVNGIIQSHNFAGSSVGIYIDKFGFIAKGGSLTSTNIEGATITGGQFRTGTTGERVVMRNDGFGGLIEFFSGLSGESPGAVDPTAVTDSSGNSRPAITMRSGVNASNPNSAIITAFSGNNGVTDNGSTVQATARAVYIGGPGLAPAAVDPNSIFWVNRFATIQFSGQITAPYQPKRMLSGTGVVNVSSSANGTLNVSFPAGYFTSAPRVMCQAMYTAVWIGTVNTVPTTSGVQVGVTNKTNASASASITVNWWAVQE